MKKLKKLSALFLSVLLLLSCMTITAYAAQSAAQDGLSAVIETDEESYEANEPILVTVTVTNTNSFAMKNVSIESILPASLTVKDGTLKSDTVDLEAGEELTLTFTAVLEKEVPPETTDPGTVEPGTSEPDTSEPDTSEPDTSEPDTSEPDTTEPGTSEPDTTEPVVTEPSTSEPDTTEPTVTDPSETEPTVTEPTVTNPTTQPTTENPNAAGEVTTTEEQTTLTPETTTAVNAADHVNGTSPITGAPAVALKVLLVVVMVAAVAFAVVMLTRKNGKKATKIISVVLSVVICGSSLVTTGVIAKAEENVSTFSVDKAIMVDGEGYQISSNIQYQSVDNNVITRGEWIIELVETLGWSASSTTVINNNFTDIQGQECEQAVVLAASHDLFDDPTGAFCPDDPADRDFVATTAVRSLMFALGEEINCADNSSIEHPKEVDVAVDLEMFSLNNDCFYPSKSVTRSESENVLEKIRDVQNSTELDENHENKIVYADGIIELSDDVLLNDNSSTLTLAIDDITRQLQTGSVVLLPDQTAYKIADIYERDGVYIVKTTEPEPEEVIESIDVQGEGQVDANDFIPAEGVKVITSPQTRSSNSGTILDNWSLNIRQNIAKNVELYADISIKDLRYETICEFSEKRGFNNVSVKALLRSFEIEGGLRVFDSDHTPLTKGGTITLGEIPVIGIPGIAMYIQLNLAYNVEGHLKLILNVSTLEGIGIQIYHNKLRYIASIDADLEIPELGASLKIGPQIAALIKLCRTVPLIDFSLSAGAAVRGNLIPRKNGMVCVDADVYLFAEMEAMQQSVFTDFIQDVGGTDIGLTYEIWNEKHSPLKKNWHFEDFKLVSQCTYHDEDVDDFTYEEMNMYSQDSNEKFTVYLGNHYLLTIGGVDDSYQYPYYGLMISETQDYCLAKVNPETLKFGIDDSSLEAYIDLSQYDDGEYYFYFAYYSGDGSIKNYSTMPIVIEVDNGKASFVKTKSYSINNAAANELQESDPSIYLDTTELFVTPEEWLEIQSLAFQITATYNTDIEKARAIYDWICNNISYDLSTQTGDVENQKPSVVLQRRTAVCDGYAQLTQAMLISVNIPCAYITGYSPKNTQDGVYVADDSAYLRDNPNHAWNMAYLDDRWVIIDSTFGQSSKDHSAWFDTDPTAFSITHRFECFGHYIVMDEVAA